MTRAAAMTPSQVRLYAAVWRWHFYAGLFVIPFLLALALSGAVMLVFSAPGDELGPAPDVAVAGAALPVSAQARLALDGHPGAVLLTYAAPAAPDRPAFFQMRQGHDLLAVAVDPYAGRVLAVNDVNRSLRTLAARFHSTLFLGGIGDKLIEAACSLAILLLASGLFLWWPRGQGRAALAPDLSARGRSLWRELHKTTGVWISLVLLAFLLTGLSWTGVWGKKLAKPWAVFSITENKQVPLSDLTHADLNAAPLREVPWALEDAALPAAGSLSGVAGVVPPVVLDSVEQWARTHGFSGPHRIALPQDETGVYTVFADDLHGVGYQPPDQRYVHIDRYTGHVLADVGYADYPPLGKAMAWAIGLHKGEAGWFNYWFNVVYLGGVVFLCLSGVAMWWARRPARGARLFAPPRVQGLAFPKAAAAVALVLALAFPMAALVLALVIGLDALVLARLPRLRRFIN